MVVEALPDGWQNVKLSDLGEINRGRSRHRPRYAEHLYGGPYPFIQTGDIKNSGGRITHYQQTYSEAGLAQSRLWPSGTLCITIAANIAETAILTFPACFPDSVVGFVADQSKCDVRFVEYSFRYLKRKIQHEASGSVQDNINLQTLEKLRLLLPPLPEQRAIASILGALDDKIELNRQMNRTLEAVAQALFKSWFVDFDPVWAKKEGRQPFGMDADTASLFPDEFEESELGLIPAGWRVVPLGEEFNITMGQSPPGNTYNEVGQGIPFYQGCRDFMFRYPLRRVYCTAPTRFARDGDTLVSVRAPVGNINMAIEPCAIGRGLAAVRHKGDGRSYTYLSMTFLKDFFAIFESHGTVFGSLSKKDFQGPSVCAPATEVINRFEQIVEPIDSQIENNELETLTLAALRDTLLPKLLSGELRVPTATESVLSQEVTLHDA